MKKTQPQNVESSVSCQRLRKTVDVVNRRRTAGARKGYGRGTEEARKGHGKARKGHVRGMELSGTKGPRKGRGRGKEEARKRHRRDTEGAQNRAERT